VKQTREFLSFGKASANKIRVLKDLEKKGIIHGPGEKKGRYYVLS
jgi:hypothetical protein